MSDRLNKRPEFAADDQTQFATSLRDLMPKLASYAQSLARNPDVAQDLVQETMLKAWRSRESFVRVT